MTEEIVQEEKQEVKRGRPKGSKSMTSLGKMTVKRKKAFLRHLEKSGSRNAAAAYLGVSRQTIYYHEKQDPVFAEKIQMAIDKAEFEIDAEIHRRGIEGIDQNIYYQGKVVGTEKKFSDRMLEFRAKTLNPERYGEKTTTNLNAKVETVGENSPKELLASLLGINIAGEQEAEFTEIDEKEA